MPYKDKEKQRESQRLWARRNRPATNAHRRLTKRKNKQKLVELKEVSSCADCGLHYPYYVMQYDHLDSATKSANIGDMMSSNMAWTTVLKEIAKCELVCGNCHAIRTHVRREG